MIICGGEVYENIFIGMPVGLCITAR